MFWLDGLDIPLVQFLDASFVERHPDEQQPITRPIGHSGAQYGANLLPIDHPRRSLTSPIFNYPYARTREALDQVGRSSDCDPCHGVKLRYGI